MLNALQIGAKISAARKSKGLSQLQLADILAVTPQAVSKWERGESLPDIITLSRLAEAVGADLNYFAGLGPAPAATAERGADEPLVPAKGWDMSAANWKDGDFSGLNNLKNRFNYSNIQGCLFVNSSLAGIELKGNNLTGCNFTGSNLSGSKIKGTHVKRNVFTACNLKGTVFSGSAVTECDFTGADLEGAIFKGCALIKNEIGATPLINAEFSGSQLIKLSFSGLVSGCSFVGCNYRNVEFNGATLKNTFFKNGDIKKIRLLNCKSDRLTRSFLQTGGADVSGVEIIDG